MAAYGGNQTPPAQPTPDAKPADLSAALKFVADLAIDAEAPKLIEIATDGFGPGLPPKVAVLYDRKGSPKIVSLRASIEEMRQDPRAREGVAEVTTLASFIGLVNRHKDGDSAVFASTAWPNPKLTAVIDYHKREGAPRHGRHRISYAFPVTDELRAWQAHNGQLMPQSEFAAFLEEHAAELVSPFDGERQEFERLFGERFGAPNDILALSRELEVYVGQKVKRQERLQTGERVIAFSEEHSNAAGEPVRIPGIFMVSVPAFVDGGPVRIPARLRYRLKGGDVVWFYQLYRWEWWLREQVQRDLAKVGAETDLPTYEGAPEKTGERGGL